MIAARPGPRHTRAMEPRTRHLVVAFAVLASIEVAACKRGKDKETEEPYPTPALPSGAATATAAPTEAPAATTPPPTTPVRPGTGTTKPDAGVVDGGPTDAGKPADAGPTDAGKAADAGSTASKIAACVNKCQAAMGTCMIPKDGGFPQPGTAAQCQAAFTACQTACAP
jgi:hypothetical protein